ncbi:MAG: ThiF family adenylyltransferase [Candidatus Berkiella sp.]
MYERYKTQMSVAQFGEQGQRRLKASSVLCVGAGGLGTAMLPYLVGAGIGKIAVSDGDLVSVDNLHRQVHFDEDCIGFNKANTLVSRLKKLNSSITLTAIDENMTMSNVMGFIEQYDVIVDASDNVSTKLMLNDSCHRLKKPLVSASILAFEGQCGIYWATRGPCLRCVFPNYDQGAFQNCREGGVVGTVAALFGAIQANETIKLCLGLQGLVGKFWMGDLLTMSFRCVQLHINPECPLCTAKDNFDKLTHSQFLSGSIMQLQQISAQELAQILQAKEPLFLLDVRNPEEYQAYNLGGTLIPLSELPQRVNEVVKDKPIVVLCHSGYRSAQAASFLLDSGFKDVKNLVGGVVAWQQAGL